jgi:hypothetical protein
MTQFGPIDYQEIKVLRFKFGDELEAGKTIVSVTMNAIVSQGIDASPTDRFLGAAVISGTDVLQKFQPSTPDVLYHIRARVVDSDGLAHVMAGNLQVSAF